MAATRSASQQVENLLRLSRHAPAHSVNLPVCRSPLMRPCRTFSSGSIHLPSSTLSRKYCSVSITGGGRCPKAALPAFCHNKQFEAKVHPATLPGTPRDFPIPEERLIQLAKELFARDVGVQDPSLLADTFRFEFPIVSLSKEEYVKAVRSFDLKGAIPDIDSHPHHWRVDPYEPNRVWFTVRVTGTHTGTLKFGSSEYKASGRVIQGAPECASLIFNADGKCTCYTGGYVMDRRVGNTKGLGALFGILAAIGGPVLSPGSIRFQALSAFQTVSKTLKSWLPRFLGGV